MDKFHPRIRHWFEGRFKQPTDIQSKSWSSIAAGENTLMAAPTGSGKTFAAFLVFIDQLFKQSLASELTEGVQILYISPLKALSNDINRNLIDPLAEIYEELKETHPGLKPVRAELRTGDTPVSERARMVRRPPHILVTTPESFFLLLSSPKARHMLKTVRSVIVDEIHSLARDKRGSHLSLSLERLDAFCGRSTQRIGISATQRPMDKMAHFLVGKTRTCTIWDLGHIRHLQLGLHIPETALSAVCSGEQWNEVYLKLVERIKAHRSTLIFVNTRRMAERVAHRLREALGDEHVASHHGSMARQRRLAAEEALKNGTLKAIVATASLELGIDIGFIDLVIQIGSPRNIAVFLQRVGRSGHAVGKMPHGQLFALTWDEALEGLALIKAVRASRLDAIRIPQSPIDILCQQIVAEVSLGECDERELYTTIAKSYSYSDLNEETFNHCLDLLANGYAEGRRDKAWIVRDRIHGKLKAKRGANLAVLNSSGAIPELGEYRVVLEDEKTVVGSVNEDFALESMIGSIFLLGNGSWQILKVGSGKMVVRDAGSRVPTIPFWEGEAPGRSFELSQEVSLIRTQIANLLQDATYEGEIARNVATPEYAPAASVLQEDGIDPWALTQIIHYVAVQKKSIGVVPNMQQVVFERFFDESGGMQLVIHSCFGANINRGFGLALRKRFCRSFNFELQASADDNGIVLSLGPNHSFPIESLFSMLNPDNIEEILIQALLDVPMFSIRWRWNATRSLAVLRSSAGKKVPPPLQRFRADDLLTAAFPMATACLENVTGDIEVPNHLLVQQTIADCMFEAMDLVGLKKFLQAKKQGKIIFIAKDSREPSPFCYQLLNALPYAFLDDAPLQERRARAVQTRRTLSPGQMQDLGNLDPKAIDAVVQDAWPLVRDSEECFSALLDFVAIPVNLIKEWDSYLKDLESTGRAHTFVFAGKRFVFATENWPLVRALFAVDLKIKLPEHLEKTATKDEALLELTRGYLAVSGPVTLDELKERFVHELDFADAIARLELAGVMLRGNFRPGKLAEVCNRGLLARIHYLTLKGLRNQIEAVDLARYVDFLCDRHGLYATKEGGMPELMQSLERLQAFEMPAGSWETEVFPGRIPSYREDLLDRSALQGELAWGRMSRTLSRGLHGLQPATPIGLFLRKDLSLFVNDTTNIADSSHSKRVLEALTKHGASFAMDIVNLSGLLPSQVTQGLKELAALGLVSCDSFTGLRAMLAKSHQRIPLSGRFYLFPGPIIRRSEDDILEAWIDLLLLRYGVVCRDLLQRESLAPPWGLLVRKLRERELRGQIRGGRFVKGLSGEQYAHEDSIEALRKKSEDRWAVISFHDPINIFPLQAFYPKGMKLRRVLLHAGHIAGYKQGEEIIILEKTDPKTEDIWRRALRLQGRVRKHVLSQVV